MYRAGVSVRMFITTVVQCPYSNTVVRGVTVSEKRAKEIHLGRETNTKGGEASLHLPVPIHGQFSAPD